MRATLRAVDFVQVLEREVKLRGKVLDTQAQLSAGERRKLVEERLDDGRVQNDHHHLEREAAGIK